MTIADPLIAELVAAWNAHDIDRILALYHHEYEDEDIGQLEPQVGMESVRQRVLHYWRAFPDLQLIAHQVVKDGDRVAFAWTWRGTHRGHFMSIPPTGRTIDVRGTSFLTLRGGKIWRVLRVWDLAGLLRNIGLLPEL